MFFHDDLNNDKNKYKEYSILSVNSKFSTSFFNNLISISYISTE